MAEIPWTIFNVSYGGGYGSLNLTKPKGARRAPKALQKEFKRQSIFIADNGVSSWRNVLWCDVPIGFWHQNNIGAWNDMDEEVSEAVFNIYQDSVSHGGFIGGFLFLGGSHSITAATYAAVAGLTGRKNTGLIVLDAHPDCCDKSNWPIHSDWLRWLIEDKYVLPENVLIIGLRQIEPQEKKFLDRYGVNYYLMNSIRGVDNPVMDNIRMMFNLEKLRKLEAIYVSVDIDVASAAYAPGTGCPSPGGFTDVELINMVKQLKVALPNLKAADIVEINPLNWWRKRILRYDPTVDLGVKLIKEIIS